MATFYHRGDHAIVSFSADVTPEEITDLVDAVDLLVDFYHYRDVLLLIDSAGGLAPALDYYLEAARRWRARGVRLRTRCIASARSAAALMLSLGDERSAEPGAALHYHRVRALVSGTLTADAASTLVTELRDHDRAMVARLVERAMRSDTPCGPCAAEPADLPVLRHLAEGTASRGVRTLARAVGRSVGRAVRRGDRRALARLYERLLGLDLPVSPALARTLRLIDHVGRPEPAAAAPEGPCGLAVPEWRALYPPAGEVPYATLTRHLLAMGETGSGKTASVILPVVAALAARGPEAFAGALVIDPKRELGPVLADAAPERAQRIEPGALGLDIMAGATWALDDDLAAGRWLTAATRVLLRIVSFVPSSPARVLADHVPDDSNAEFFDRNGTDLARCVLAFILMLTREDTPPAAGWCAGDAEALGWCAALAERAAGPANLVALTAWALESALTAPLDGASSTFTVGGDDEDDDVKAEPRWLFARIAARARAVWGAAPGEGRDLLERVADYWAPMVPIEKQYAGVLATARLVCAELADPVVASTLYLGCEPAWRRLCAAGGALDLAPLVAPGAPGRLLVYQPSLDAQGTLVGRVLKSLFFEAVLADPARAPGAAVHPLPLAVFVADEAHRYVSSDRHGEQSFLDIGRAFGAACVLACQSVASIEHALAHGAGTRVQNDAAVAILWNNTATKLFFRSTDDATADRLERLAPVRGGLAPVTRVRPLSALAPGECYAVLADGRFERARLEGYGLGRGAETEAQAPRRQRARRRPDTPDTPDTKER